MTGFIEYAPYIGIALFVLTIAVLAVRFRFPERMPGKIAASVCMLAVLAYAGMGVKLRLYEERLEHPELTVGDIVRPALSGAVATDATVESWQEAFEQFDLVWTDEGAPLVERPTGLLSFPEGFTGYVEGSGEADGLELTAVVGFDGSDISWFTCHAYGEGRSIAMGFFQTCWEAAAIGGADQEATAAWISAEAAAPWGELGVSIGRSCPVTLAMVSIGAYANTVNAQLTISRAELC